MVAALPRDGQREVMEQDRLVDDLTPVLNRVWNAYEPGFASYSYSYIRALLERESDREIMDAVKLLAKSQRKRSQHGP
jgi:hypothetical protein